MIRNVNLALEYHEFFDSVACPYICLKHDFHVVALRQSERLPKNLLKISKQV